MIQIQFSKIFQLKDEFWEQVNAIFTEVNCFQAKECMIKGKRIKISLCKIEAGQVKLIDFLKIIPLEDINTRLSDREFQLLLLALPQFVYLSGIYTSCRHKIRESELSLLHIHAYCLGSFLSKLVTISIAFLAAWNSSFIFIHQFWLQDLIHLIKTIRILHKCLLHCLLSLLVNFTVIRKTLSLFALCSFIKFQKILLLNILLLIFALRSTQLLYLFLSLRKFLFFNFTKYFLICELCVQFEVLLFQDFKFLCSDFTVIFKILGNLNNFIHQSELCGELLTKCFIADRAVGKFILIQHVECFIETLLTDTVLPKANQHRNDIQIIVFSIADRTLDFNHFFYFSFNVHVVHQYFNLSYQ